MTFLKRTDMKTNEIKKGMVVELRNGWFGVMADNMRGNTRMVDVDGLYREIGSVYSHDIVKVFPTKVRLGDNIDAYKGDDDYGQANVRGITVEHTKPQLTLKERVW
jgi:hypothetical protein